MRAGVPSNATHGFCGGVLGLSKAPEAFDGPCTSVRVKIN